VTLRLKANRRFPSVPVVTDDPKNHTQVLMSVKEALDIGQRRTGDLLNSFIRVEDLIDLGLITIEGNTNAIVGADLSEIADIGDLSGAATGDFLRYDGTQWINDDLHNTDITQVMVTQHQAALSIAWSQLTGTPPSLDDLLDVDAPAPADGDVLTWNDASSEWIASAPTGGGGATFLDDLEDVEAMYPGVGDFLAWDGYSWVPESIPDTGTGTIIFADASVPGGNTVANTTVETTFASDNDIDITLLQEGIVHRGEIHGTYSTDASAGTLRIRVKLGGTTLLDTTAFTATNSITDRGWKLEWTFIVTADGAGGDVEVQGVALFSSGVTSAQVIHLQNTTPVAVNLASTLTPLTVTAQWGTADPQNSITLREMILFAEGVDFIAPDRTKALLHFEDADGTTTFIDEYGHTFTRTGSAQIDTAVFHSGASSLLLARATTDAVLCSHADFAMGTGDFTIEGWARWEGALTDNRALFCWGNTNWAVYTFGGQIAVFDGVSSNIIIGGFVSLDTWYHVAICRVGTSLRLFFDGVQVGSTATNSTNFSTGEIIIGNFNTGTSSFNGHVDEVRVTIGQGRYTANFTPPTPPFPDP
jgi:hypothetical protein